jgi:predicted 2-oxoglutarate/Fe(II)-dependent dioxygenase YbiX
MTLMLGTPAPVFTGPTPTRPDFSFGSVAGRYVLLCFLPCDPQVRRRVVPVLEANRALLDERRLVAFVVVRDPEGLAEARDGFGLRWFLDADGAISRLYGALTPDGSEEPHWLLLDPTLRLLMAARIDEGVGLFARIRRLPQPESHALVEMTAPVLIVPRILEPALCRRLIEHYNETGGEPSGVMRDVGGRTVGVLDDFKRRRDAAIQDPELQMALRVRIDRRLLPEIEKAFQFKATRIERYIVACYDAGEGGYFRPHRDNTTAGTAHRQFAVSINLNAEEFEGGDLRFPEYGSRTYRPPTGGAVVFSCSLLHEATPVTRGTRYATLPFLYDDAGAEVRRRNAHLIQSAGEPNHLPAADAYPPTAA